MNVKRLIPVGLTAAVLIGVGACSSSSGDPASPVAAAPGEAAAAPAASSAPSATGSSGVASSSAAAKAAEAAKRPGHESNGTVSTDRDLTELNPVAADLYKFTAGNGVTKQAFTRTASSLNGLPAQARYLRAQQRRTTVAQVAVYSFDAGTTSSAQFRGQLLNQLVGATAKSTKVRTETAAGHTFATSGTKVGVVGAFDGDTAVVVVGRKGVGSLSAARNAVYAYLDR